MSTFKIGDRIPADFVVVREKPTEAQLKKLAAQFNRRSTFASRGSK